MNLEFDEMADKSITSPKKEVKKKEDGLNHESNVKHQVLESLGKPENLYKIRASNVFYDSWRVDIWTWRWLDEETKITKSLRIEYSYFIKYNKNLGRIIESNPPIEQIYS